MLTVDMDKRVTMDEIRNHPWLNEGYTHPPPDLSIPRELPVDDIDEHVRISWLEAVAMLCCVVGAENVRGSAGYRAGDFIHGRRIFCLGRP